MLFFIIGMAYVLEYVVFVLFESYDYDPDFMTNEYFDNLFGSLTSQAFAFPIMAMVVAAYQLKFRYILFISSMFMGIEELFLHWDIYTHHWWKTIYTGVLMTIGFSISKVWYVWLTERYMTFVHYATFFLGMLAITSTIMFMLLAYFHNNWFYTGWFASATHDSVNATMIYVCIVTILLVWSIAQEFFYWSWNDYSGAAYSRYFADSLWGFAGIYYHFTCSFYAFTSRCINSERYASKLYYEKLLWDEQKRRCVSSEELLR